MANRETIRAEQEKRQYERWLKRELLNQGRVPDLTVQYGADALKGLNPYERNAFLQDKLKLAHAYELGLALTGASGKVYDVLFEDKDIKKATYSIHCDNLTVASGKADFRGLDAQERVQLLIEQITGDEIVDSKVMDFDEVYCKVHNMNKNLYWYQEYSSGMHNVFEDGFTDEYEAAFPIPKYEDYKPDTYLQDAVLRANWEELFKNYVSKLDLKDEFKYDINWLANFYQGTKACQWLNKDYPYTIQDIEEQDNKKAKARQARATKETLKANREQLAKMYEELAGRNLLGLQRSTGFGMSDTRSKYAKASDLKLFILPLLRGEADFTLPEQTPKQVEFELKLREWRSKHYEEGLHGVLPEELRSGTGGLVSEKLDSFDAMKAHSGIQENELRIANQIHSLCEYVIGSNDTSTSDKLLAEEILGLYDRQFSGKKLERTSPELYRKELPIKPVSRTYITVPEKCIESADRVASNSNIIYDTIKLPAGTKLGKRTLTGVGTKVIEHKVKDKNEKTGYRVVSVDNIAYTEYKLKIWGTDKPENCMKLENGDRCYLITEDCKSKKRDSDGKITLVRGASGTHTTIATGEVEKLEYNWNYEAILVDLTTLADTMEHSVMQATPEQWRLIEQGELEEKTWEPKTAPLAKFVQAQSQGTIPNTYSQNSMQTAMKAQQEAENNWKPQPKTR